jgi:hypothetical protein
MCAAERMDAPRRHVVDQKGAGEGMVPFCPTLGAKERNKRDIEKSTPSSENLANAQSAGTGGAPSGMYGLYTTPLVFDSHSARTSFNAAGFS